MPTLLRILGAASCAFLLLFIAKSTKVLLGPTLKTDPFSLGQPFWYASVIGLIFVGTSFFALGEIIDRLPPKSETEEETEEE